MTGNLHDPAPRRGPAEPATRLAALLAEASSPDGAGPPGHGAPATSPAHRPGETARGETADGPAHRWAGAVRTRVPPAMLLLALAALGVLAWVLLGPGAPGRDPGAQGTPALAELDLAAPSPAGPQAGTAAPTNAPAAGATGDAPAAAGAASAGTRLLVHVTGQVLRPGVVTLEPGARVVDAVEAAGGLTDAAVTDGVNLAAPVTDGQQVLVPDASVAPPGAAVPGGPAPAPAATGPSAPDPGAPDPGGALNLNTATAAELEALPRVGPVLAQRIVAFREEHGGFAAVGDLDAVEGIGPTLMEALAPLVSV